MSRPDLAEIVSAVLAELGQATGGGLARGPGGRPEVPMRRAATATPTAGPLTPTAGAAGVRAPRQREGAGATPPVTVAEATACSPRRRPERAAPDPGSDARAAGPEMVQRIVADLQRRLDDPTRG